MDLPSGHFLLSFCLQLLSLILLFDFSNSIISHLPVERCRNVTGRVISGLAETDEESAGFEHFRDVQIQRVSVDKKRVIKTWRALLGESHATQDPTECMAIAIGK